MPPPRSHPLDQRFRANRLLATLSSSESGRLLADSVPVALPFKTVLYEMGEPLQHAYFPIDCLVSLLTSVNGHDIREVGLVGREGMIGVSLALGVGVSAARCLVQGTGTAFRVESSRFIDEYGRRGAFHKEVNQYIHELMVQTAQTAACNISHPVEAGSHAGC